MDVINFKVGDDDYQLLPHTGFAAMNLDRKVIGIVGRFLAGANNVSVAEVYAKLSTVLETYSDSEFRYIVEETLNRVTVTTPGKKSERLANSGIIASHFVGKFFQMYCVMFEVWRLEHLGPFGEAPITEQNGN